MKIILFVLVFAFFSIPALAQKTVPVNFKVGETIDIEAQGTTVFTVKLKKDQSYKVEGVVNSRNSKMSGESYIKNADGSINEESISSGQGPHGSEFSGYINQPETLYFKIRESKTAKFIFRITVKQEKR